MKCPKCKTKNANNAKYCSSCQYPLIKNTSSSQKKCPKCGKTYRADMQYCMKCQCELVEKNKSKLPIIIIGSTSAVVLIASAIIGTTVVYPRYAFNKAIENNDSKQLVSVCKDYPGLLDNDNRVNKYNTFIDKRSDDYVADTISYEEVTDDFENFDIINSYFIDSDTLENTNDERIKIEEIHVSRLSFQEAEDSFYNKEYQTAEEKYSSVIEKDEKYYLLAQDKMKEIDELKQSYIKQSDENIQNDDYDGSIEVLTEGLTYFGYDENYSSEYYDKIVDTVSRESDYLMDKGLYFSYNGENGAFNIVYSYLNQEQYADSDILKSKLVEISNKSESSEIANAEKNIGLTNKNKVLDRVADKAAKDYCNDHSIQDDNSYIVSVCKDDDGVQGLLTNISKEKKVNVALISNIAVTSEDFSNACKDKLESYDDYIWNYTGIGRYYDEQNRTFSWMVIIIYETE